MKEACEQYREWLKENLVGELDPGRRDELENHLAQCGACSREQSELEAAWGALSELRDEPAPQHFFVYEDLPHKRSGWNPLSGLSQGWRWAFATLLVGFGIVLVLLISQARVEIGSGTIAFSFGPFDQVAADRKSQEELAAAIRSVVQEENRQWISQFQEEVDALVKKGSQDDRASFALAMTALEKQFEDRLDSQEESLKVSFTTALGESVDLLTEQRRTDAAQIRQVLSRFAAFNRYQVGQSTAIIETLTDLADNRSDGRQGAR